MKWVNIMHRTGTGELLANYFFIRYEDTNVHTGCTYGVSANRHQHLPTQPHWAPCAGLSLFPYLLYTRLCLCVTAPLALEQSPFMPPHLFLPLAAAGPEPQSLLSLRNVTFFFLSDSTFQVESLLFSPRCLHVVKDKVNTVGEFAFATVTINLVYHGERSGGEGRGGIAEGDAGGGGGRITRRVCS